MKNDFGCMFALVLVSSLVSVLAVERGIQNDFNITSFSNVTSANEGNTCEERYLDLRTIFYTILLVCVFIVGIVSNGVAIIVIYLSRSLRKHPTNLLVASLNLCDIGVILCSIPLRLDGFLYGKFCFDIHVCRFFNITDLLFHISSISHLFVIAIERFIAVHFPFFHRYSINTKQIVKVIVLTWFYSVLWMVAGLFDWENLPEPSTMILSSGAARTCIVHNRIYHIVVYAVTYIIPLAVMAVLYSLILRSAFEHQRRMSKTASTHSENQQQQLQQQKQQQHNKKNEQNMSKTVAIIYGAFVICWLPVALISIINQTSPKILIEFMVQYPTLSDAIFTTFIVVLPAIHSCLNPFIYIIYHEAFRNAVRELIITRKRKQSSFLFDSNNTKLSKFRRQDQQ